MDLAQLWFWIVAFLFVGYFVLDGFDFGVGMSIPFSARTTSPAGRSSTRSVPCGTSTRRGSSSPVPPCSRRSRVVRHALQRVLPALLAILLALIARGVSFEYRHQRDSLRWKRSFDA